MAKRTGSVQAGDGETSVGRDVQGEATDLVVLDSRKRPDGVEHTCELLG